MYNVSVARMHTRTASVARIQLPPTCTCTCTCAFFLIPVFKRQGSVWEREGMDGEREVVSLTDIKWEPTGGGKKERLWEEAERVGVAMERCRDVERKAQLMSEQAELWRRLGR